MKSKLYVPCYLILLIFLSCSQKSLKEDSIIISKEGAPSDLNNAEITKEEKINKEIELDIKDRFDSLRLEVDLDYALEISGQNIQSNYHFEEYEVAPIDSSWRIFVNVTTGHLFSNRQKHVLIRRIYSGGDVYLNLYQIINDELDSVIFRKQHGLTYINDTIKDVNGDGLKDFLVHWYPQSGCCRRNVYNVYLNQGYQRRFTEDYEFINPTFSPKEKIIRGVEYGHPGEAGLYKYRWKGLEVDTIEFIYPDINHIGRFLKTKKSYYRPTEKEGVILKAVPIEYRNIESYEWFSLYKRRKKK